MLNDKNIVKVITREELSNDNFSKAISFSREILNNRSKFLYLHIGVYIYKSSILNGDKILPIPLPESNNKESKNLSSSSSFSIIPKTS